MADAPQPNSPEARTPTGELKDQSPTSTPETKPTEAKAPEAKAPEPEEATDDKSLLNKDEKKPETKPTGAPEKYEPFKVPDGYELDTKVAEEAGTIFRDLGLSQDAAQKLVDFYSAKATEAANAPYEAYQNMRNGWRDEVVKAPDLGDGKDLKPEVKSTISKALDSLGNPQLAQQFREAMDLTGAGDHPAFVRAFYALAKQVTEGTAVRGAGPTEVKKPDAAPKSIANAMYPNLP